MLPLWLLLLAPSLHAERAVQAWVQRYPGYWVQGSKVAADQDGNLLVAGYAVMGMGQVDRFIIKYASTGEALWTNRWIGSDATFYAGPAMALDTNGNVYVADFSVGCNNGCNDDYLAVAYFSNGLPLWSNSYSGTFTSPMPPTTSSADDRAQAVAVDDSGNAYVSGWSGPVDGSWAGKYVTIACANGGTAMWTNYSTQAYSSYASLVAVDNLGHVYVTGTGCAPAEGCAPGFLVIAYSSSGTPLWAKVLDYGGAYGVPKAIGVDGSGNVYVTGQAWGGYLTIAYSSTGTRLWLNSYREGYPRYAYPQALGVGSNGNIYVTGYSTNGPVDYVTIAYSNLGVPLWTNRYNGPGDANDCAQALAVGRNGNVYVTGYSGGSGSGTDYLTIAYSSSGTPLWTNRYDGPANLDDGAQAVTVDGSGNVYVTGYSSTTPYRRECLTIKYVPAPDILFSGIDLLSDGAYRLTITPPTNTTFGLEVSTNLASWLTLTNYTNLPFTSIQYTDAPALGFPNRFYRAVWSP